MSSLLQLRVGASLVAGVLTATVVAACSRDTIALKAPPPTPVLKTEAQMVDLADPDAMQAVLDRIADRRVILVGESHDRYDHHQNQLAVIRGLRERGLDIAIGMEFFQAPFQPQLDAFLAGEIHEKQLLKQTEYYSRWRYDYRLYRDILEYARAQGLPLVALNAPSELVARVSQGGLAALTPEERSGLMVSAPGGEQAYEARLRPIFDLHGTTDETRFQRFADVQRLWDAYMARTASDFLARNPSKRLVILAGAGHVVYRDAIPSRLAGLSARDLAVLATGRQDRYSGSAPDVLFAERDLALKPAGQIGMDLAGKDNRVMVKRIRPKGPADLAGLRAGDQILSIAGEPVRSLDDVRLALLDRLSGDALRIDWMRWSEGSTSVAQHLAAPLTLL